MAPKYLIEEYKAYKPEVNTFVAITVCVSPFDRTEPGLKYCYDNKKDVSVSFLFVVLITFIDLFF